VKRRSDRNHIIYELEAPDGCRYIGVTVVTKNAKKSLEMRWKRHIYYAEVKQGKGLLQDSIRKYRDSIRHRIIEKVRGKQNAHDLERKLIKETKPELNIECTNKKKRNSNIIKRED
jgi:hypothetical protein